MHEKDPPAMTGEASEVKPEKTSSLVWTENGYTPGSVAVEGAVQLTLTDITSESQPAI